MKMDGCVAFISGSAMGVGKGVACALLQEGAKVCIADVAVQDGEATEAEFKKRFGEDRAFFTKCDVTQEQSLKDAFALALSRFGRIDLMVNNAGIVNESNWKLMSLININGVIVGTQLAVEHMRKDKGGHGGVIINTASMVGLISRHVFPVYVATKHAVVGYTNSWGVNPYMSKMGIRVGTVCPTAVDTAFQRFRDEQLLYPEDFKEMLRSISLMPVSRVVEGFMKIIKDDDSNGKSLCISKNDMKYMKNQLVDD